MATLKAVAIKERRRINPEKFFCLLRAILLAINRAIFILCPMRQPEFTIFLLIYCLPICIPANAQNPDHIFSRSIQTIKLYKAGDPRSYPLLVLGDREQLELHFDDLDADIKNYYYTFQLCNADWTPANLQPYDYLRGFLTNRIRNYRPSSLSQVRYTHYQAFLPESGSEPTRAGNYMLKVFLNDDTSQLAFTKRVLIASKKVAINAQVKQPFDGQILRTHQQLQIGVTPVQVSGNPFAPTDLHVWVLQNRGWQLAQAQKTPTLFRGNYFEYTDQGFSLFPAGQEWRWVDLRSFRLRSERVSRIVDSDSTARVDIWVNPDYPREGKMSFLNRDINGAYIVESRDNPNAQLQGEYAWVHFSFIPRGGRVIPGRSVYLYGELTNYALDSNSKMKYDPVSGTYTKTCFLKQGYYNYQYLSSDEEDRKSTPVNHLTEGDYWGTENEYLVLVYVRPVGARADELIGHAWVRSAFQQ